MAIPYICSYDGTLPFSDTVRQVALATNTAQTITVPGTGAQKYTAHFSYNSTANVWVGNNVTAVTPPAGTTTTLQYVEFRPDKRFVIGGDVLSFVTPDASGYVGVEFRSIPS